MKQVLREARLKRLCVMECQIMCSTLLQTLKYRTIACGSVLFGLQVMYFLKHLAHHEMPSALLSDWAAHFP